MKGASDAFLAAIRKSHTIVTYVDVLNQGAVIQADIPVADGVVTLDATAEIRGRVEMTVAGEALVPLTADALLAPYGNELRVRHGIRFPDGTEETISLGVFRIDETPVTDPGRSVQITAYDRSMIVRDARLEAPHIVVSGTEWTFAIAELVDGAGWWTPTNPLPTIISPSTFSSPLIVAPEQEDRWKLCTEWGKAIGYDVTFDGDGALRALPVVDYDLIDPHWTVNDGETGVLITAQRKWRRDGIFNRVIAIGETPTGVYRGVATDDNPASPTYYYGAFGKVPRWFSSPLMNTTEQCQTAAEAMLRRSLGQSSEVTFTALPNPALEPGDLLQVEREALGINSQFIIDAVTIPLSAAGGQTLKVRAKS